MHTRRRWARLAISGIVFAALAGFGTFAFLAWRSITVERADPDQADRHFVAIRDQFSGSPPLLRVEPDGRVVRRQVEPGDVTPANRLRVLAYRPSRHRTVHANVPFWFLRAKGPAIEWSLRDTGLDLQRLGITPTELQRYGARLVLDESTGNGERLMVWTE